MKIVVGIYKRNESKVADYENKGYHIENIDDHVRLLGEKLFRRKLSKDEVQRIRNEGYKVSSRYWINLAIMAAKKKNKIVIAGLQEQDNKTPFSKII